ncbi:MAG: CDP-diacylglycerol--glycerol-3-phosphate 3-phosphatidyltransferase [Clostridiales bacterium]|nr:CDP-diacylglycerol--glycerol-3-phosphate 3-phosphatidyltransferase [Clostridiales bacterium]
MNLPNKLSVARVLCIPAIVTLLHFPEPACRYAAAALFIIGCLTDFFDGRIARKRKLVTDFGKFIDPVADKLLVLTTLIMLIHLGKMPAWIVIVILCRELAVDGLRMVAVTKGQVIAAGPLGKWKTACQMVLISAMLILNLGVFEAWPLTVLAAVVVILTLGSAVDYFVRNAAVLAEK